MSQNLAIFGNGNANSLAWSETFVDAHMQPAARTLCLTCSRTHARACNSSCCWVQLECRCMAAFLHHYHHHHHGHLPQSVASSSGDRLGWGRHICTLKQMRHRNTSGSPTRSYLCLRIYCTGTVFRTCTESQHVLSNTAALRRCRPG